MSLRAPFAYHVVPSHSHSLVASPALTAETHGISLEILALSTGPVSGTLLHPPRRGVFFADLLCHSEDGQGSWRLRHGPDPVSSSALLQGGCCPRSILVAGLSARGLGHSAVVGPPEM